MSRIIYIMCPIVVITERAHFIKKIEAIDHVSDDSYWVSLDVRSLYTYIPHKEKIEAVIRKELKLLNKS